MFRSTPTPMCQSNITLPFVYTEIKKRLTDRLPLLLVLAYGYGGVWACPPLLGWGRYEVEPYGTACSLNWSDIPLSYLVLVFIFIYLLPIIIMVICYSRMISYTVNSMSSVRRPHFRWEIYLIKVHKGLIKLINFIIVECFIRIMGI